MTYPDGSPIPPGQPGDPGPRRPRLSVMDHAFDLLPALLLISLLAAGSGMFVVTFDFG